MRTLTVLFFAGALFAQHDHDDHDGPRRGGPPPNLFRVHPALAALDADRDGVISAGERANAPRALKALDKNGDGQLSGDELRPQFGPGPRGPGGPGGAPANNSDMVATLLGFDKNADGALTKDEVPERMQGLFARGDADRDGKLTRDELTKLAGAPVAAGRGGPGEGPGERRGEGRGGRGPGDRVMAALDLDRDGSVSAAELAQSAQSLTALDANKDGRLTEDEVRPSFGGPGGGPGGGRRGGNPAEMANHLFEEWDANGDGKLAQSEMPERLRERFAAADADKNGSLSRSELTALLQAGFGGARR